MGAVVELEVPREILESARITPGEALQELAVALYAEGKLSPGKARKARDLAGMPHWRFRQLLGSREVPPHYDLTDIDEDRATLRQLGIA